MRSAVRLLLGCVLGACLLGPPMASAGTVISGLAVQRSTPSHDEEAQALVLEAVLDGHVLSDSMLAYPAQNDWLVPLGELARLLTLAITVDVERGRASGFVVKEAHGFGLNVAQRTVQSDGQAHTFEPGEVRVMGDDIYVALSLLQQWLPLNLRVDMPSLQLRIKPRVTLPMQARLQRERMAGGPGARAHRSADEGYPYQHEPVSLWRAPFIDQTFGGDARWGKNSAQYKTAYAAFITTDALGMEASAYVSASREQAHPELRWTLSRHDPDGGLLGPLSARSLDVGHVVMPGVPQVLISGKSALGVAVSNRALNQPTSFDRHSLRGDLPAGWDVTLYYNDALTGFQMANVDGRYAFDDLPLAYGPNEFRLVFNGPLGQVRVERQSFLLDQSAVKPGEFHYALTAQGLGGGGQVQVARFDHGLSPSLSVGLGLVSKTGGPSGGSLRRDHALWSLRGHMAGMITSVELITSPQGGSLGELSLKTRVAGMAVDMRHLSRTEHFVSDFHAAGPDSLRQRDAISLNASARLAGCSPVALALEAARESLWNESRNTLVAARVSSIILGTAASNGWRWQDAAGTRSVDSSLQLSRRVMNVGLNAYVDVGVQPKSRLRTAAFTADHQLNGGWRLNGGALVNRVEGSTQLSAGVSRDFGRFALALNGGYSSKRELVVGMQLFMAIGREPRTGRWFAEPQPMASTGAVSAQAFVDTNMNGVRDEGEEAVPHAGFVINRGGRHATRTDQRGEALVTRLPTGRYTDIALDAATLEDPQWRPTRSGVRILPRPGLVQTLDFPVVYTSEVEGTVYLESVKGQRRGIGDVQLELVDAQGEIIATTRSSADGYYLLHQVMPGQATLRVARQQVSKLGLGGQLARPVHVPLNGDFLSGQDLVLNRQ